MLDVDPNLNLIDGDFIGLECKRCNIVSPMTTVVGLGLDGITVVVEGGIIMVCPIEREEEGLALMEALEEEHG